MKVRNLITAAILAIGAVTAAQAVIVQTYGQDEGIWQAERDRAYRERGPAGLVDYDRANARRFYGNAYPSLRELDRQIRIDRAETELDTQERADQVRYGFGRGNGTGTDAFGTPVQQWRSGQVLPREYRTWQNVVNDWRNHRLPSPSRGQQWVQIGADYLLINNAGVIQSIQQPR